MLKNNIKHAININKTDIILLMFNFSFKKKKPKTMLIIGVRKYPKEAFWTCWILTEYINPVQFIAIKIPVIERIIMFLDNLKTDTNSLISFVNSNKINNKTKDQSPLCIATSMGGIYFIWSKKSGCGIPQNSEAKQV